MMVGLLFVILICTVIGAIARPWIGVAAFYFLALATPQYIWSWIFKDLRVSLFVSVAALLGTAVAVVSGQARMDNFRNSIPWLMLLLTVMVNISNAVSTVAVQDVGFILPMTGDEVVGQFNKIVFFFCLSLIVLDTEEKLRYIMFMLLAVALLHTYWPNKVYLTGESWRFGGNGRLSGPDKGDENVYAATLVALLPVLYFVAMTVKSKPAKVALLLCVPLLWHGIFLTGSRAGIIALVVTTALIALRSKSKLLGLLLIPGLIFAFLTQGGYLVDRVSTTVETSEQLEQGEAIDPRLESWQVGLQITRDYPLFGVGIRKFIHVYDQYADTPPHVAHNTMLQIASEAGLIACFAYVAMFIISIRQSLRNRKLIKKYGLGQWHLAYTDTFLASMVGYFIMSMFLDLIISEFFYFYLMFAIAHNSIVQREIAGRDIVQDQPKRMHKLHVVRPGQEPGTMPN